MRNRNFAPVRIGLTTRQSFPAVGVDIANENRAAEQVGAVDGINVPDADGALRAVDFETGQFGIPDVETRDQCRDGTVDELDRAADVGVDLDVDDLPFVGSLSIVRLSNVRLDIAAQRLAGPSRETSAAT
jgi:hypothetical protein